MLSKACQMLHGCCEVRTRLDGSAHPDINTTAVRSFRAALPSTSRKPAPSSKEKG